MTRPAPCVRREHSADGYQDREGDAMDNGQDADAGTPRPYLTANAAAPAF